MDPNTPIDSGSADLVTKLGYVDAATKDAARINPDEVHDPRGWPDASTVVKWLLIGVVALLLIGWALTAFNH